jgi:hypothetical protein
MTFRNTVARDFNVFLDKFTILDDINWDDWAIDLAVSQVCDDIRRDAAGALISLSIDKYLRSGWNLEDITRFIYNSFAKHGDGLNIGLLLSIKYDAPRDRQLYVNSIVNSHQLASCFAGIDLVGNEAAMDKDFHGNMLYPWFRMGKICRVHAGELPGTGYNVREALYNMPITNVAHGIHADPSIWTDAARMGVMFDVAIHSNLYTGSINYIDQHPIAKMLAAGCKVTLSTDDPTQFEVGLDDEYRMAVDNKLITEAEAESIMGNSMQLCGIPLIKST